MITEVTGDIFASTAQTLVNPVNTVGVMGSGLALEFRRRFPEMFASYVYHCASGRLTTGTLMLWRGPDRWVLNFPTKHHWRDPSRIEWIDAGLANFAATYEQRGIESVAFPRLGCGRGGLSWSEVRPVMRRHLDPLPIPVWVYSPPAPSGTVTP